ncbi:hypothetical protein PV326_002967 [Microctonus aethiopoides]|nr:hypothetical protein PV326_002967 [Microctonus aethiopoides]
MQIAALALAVTEAICFLKFSLESKIMPNKSRFEPDMVIAKVSIDLIFSLSMTYGVVTEPSLLFTNIATPPPVLAASLSAL